MEEVKELLLEHGIPEEYAIRVANMSWDIWNIYESNYELEDIEMVAEEMEIELTEKQRRQVQSRWQRLESYGQLDREGIEYAVKETIKEN